MKRIKRRGLYCTKHNQPCEDAYILINSFKGCMGGVRCDCPKCQHSTTVKPASTGFRNIPGGFEVVRIDPLRAGKE